MEEYFTTAIMLGVMAAIIVAANCIVLLVKFIWCVWHDIEKDK